MRRQVNSVAIEQRSIAIIDDDESVRIALSGLVRSLGHRALAFGSAEEFMAAGAATGSACIVSDIQMPGISGIELKRQLNDAGCAAPVILITARTEPEMHERAFASGALCVLRKPFAAEVFLECLERALAG